MVQPNFVAPKLPKAKFSIRTIAILVIVLAGAVLAFSFGSQNPNSSIGKLVRRAGQAVGLEIGSPIDETAVQGGGSGASDGSSAPAIPPVTAPQLAVVSSDEILRLVNEYRRSNGLPEIVKNDRFCEWAYHRAETISTNWSQDVYQSKRDEVFKAVCANCSQIGELIARNISSPEETVNQWVDGKVQALNLPYNVGCAGGYTVDGVNAYIAFVLGEKVTE